MIESATKKSSAFWMSCSNIGQGTKTNGFAAEPQPTLSNQKLKVTAKGSNQQYENGSLEKLDASGVYDSIWKNQQVNFQQWIKRS